MQTAVKTRSVIFFIVSDCCRKKYHTIPIIAARTTGAQSQTKIEKVTIQILTADILIHFGRKPNKKVMKSIQRVILKPLTAIKCVKPELLKSCFKSAEIFSRAQNKIPPRSTASS